MIQLSEQMCCMSKASPCCSYLLSALFGGRAWRCEVVDKGSCQLHLVNETFYAHLVLLFCCIALG